MAVLPVIAVIATVAAAGISAYASYESGQAQKEAGKYNAAVAENNAIAARNSAMLAEEDHREKSRRILATIRARSGASGTTMEGSPLLVLSDSARQSEIDALRIRYGGELEATGYKAQAGLSLFQGDQAATAGALTGGATMLTGLGQAGRDIYNYKK
jgi:hypothetical protein